jgi:hypothetical protein
MTSPRVPDEVDTRPLRKGRTNVDTRGSNLAQQVRRLKQRRRYAGPVLLAMLGISAVGLLDLSHLHRPWRRIIEVAWGLTLLRVNRG